LKTLTSERTNSYNKQEKEEYFNRLAMAVRQADEFRLTTAVADKARKLLDEYIEQRMDKDTKRKLENSLKSKVKRELEEALAQSDEHGYRTTLTRSCRAMLEKVNDAEAALGVSIDNVCEEDLIRSLEMAHDFKYDSPTVQVARRLLDDILHCNSLLDQGKTKKNHEILEEAIGFADQINLNTQHVNEAKGLYGRIMDCRAKLEVALRLVNRIELESALAIANGFEYDAPLVHDCSTLLHRVLRIEEVCEEASRTLEEDMVRTVANAANEIKMDSQYIQFFNGLVTGDYDHFLSEQFKKAKENNNPHRAIRIAMKRKDILVKQNAHNFKLSKYNKLKTPEGWARQKWFGNKEKIALGMLKHNSNTIHSPLLVPTSSNQSNKQRSREVVKSSKHAHATILKFCGFKKGKKLEKLVCEMIANGLRLPEIRVELYIQIMKTCTVIPPDLQKKNPNGVTKAIELMAFLLSFIPPPLDFEDYLECWIRDKNYASFCEKWKMTGLIRRIVYLGQKQSPKEEICTNLSSYLVGENRQRGFSEPPLPDNYNDLKQPFSGSGYNVGGGGEGLYPNQGPSEPVKESVWRPIVDEESGDTYFYNEETGESCWEIPEGE